MTRLVEGELKDRQLYLVAGLIAYSWHFDEFDDDVDKFLETRWAELIQLLHHNNWVNGRHEGDCTKVPATCHRCTIESWVDEAKKLLEQYGS
jgi:hypothetical protein